MGDEMKGRVVVITGAGGAIGKPMAFEVARRGATVVLAGRSPRIDAAADEVRRETGNRSVEAINLDLGSMRSVREAAADLVRRHPRIHVLINNAAVFSKARKTTADGFELVFGTNHLGHFLFTNLILGALKEAAPSRVVLMSMDSKTPINFDDLMSERRYSPLDALTMSKAAITSFGLELAAQLHGSGVTVNVVNPELTKSTLPREAPLPLRLVFALFGASPEHSKDYALRVACDPEFERVTGHYFRKKEDKPVPALQSDPEVRRRLWTESARLVGL